MARSSGCSSGVNRRNSSDRSNSWNCDSKICSRSRRRRSPPAEPSVLLASLLPSANRPAVRYRNILPRQTRRHVPKESVCPDCGGMLGKLGEDVSEMLEYVWASFFGIRHVRPKLSCHRCERIVQAPAPSRPIERGLAGPGLLGACADFEVCRPLAFLLAIGDLCVTRRGTGALDSGGDWVGGTSALLEPLVDALRRCVMAADKLHADDTRVPVLAPGNGKTKTGRLWTYARDDRPAGDSSTWSYGLPTRLIAETNIRTRHLARRFKERCRPMPTRASIGFTRVDAFRKRGAGCTFAASFMTSTSPRFAPS